MWWYNEGYEITILGIWWDTINNWLFRGEWRERQTELGLYPNSPKKWGAKELWIQLPNDMIEKILQLTVQPKVKRTFVQDVNSAILPWTFDMVHIYIYDVSEENRKFFLGLDN